MCIAPMRTVIWGDTHTTRMNMKDWGCRHPCGMLDRNCGCESENPYCMGEAQKGLVRSGVAPQAWLWSGERTDSPGTQGQAWPLGQGHRGCRGHHNGKMTCRSQLARKSCSLDKKESKASLPRSDQRFVELKPCLWLSQNHRLPGRGSKNRDFPSQRSCFCL